MSRITLEQIQETLAPLNWKVVSDSYTNLNTEMQFQCDNGHSVYAPWGRLRNKIECPTCKARQAVVVSGEIRPKQKGVNRILALDQATHITGYAVFDGTVLVSTGIFDAPGADEIERISAIESWVQSMIANWRPDFIGLEGIQFQDESAGRRMGVTVFETLARLQGVLLLAAYRNNIKCEVCATNTWRHQIGVKGKARADRKRSMQMLVKEWYQIDVSDDIADAIGIGYYLSHNIQSYTVAENWET